MECVCVSSNVAKVRVYWTGDFVDRLAGGYRRQIFGMCRVSDGAKVCVCVKCEYVCWGIFRIGDFFFFGVLQAKCFSSL